MAINFLTTAGVGALPNYTKKDSLRSLKVKVMHGRDHQMFSSPESSADGVEMIRVQLSACSHHMTQPNPTFELSFAM